MRKRKEFSSQKEGSHDNLSIEKLAKEAFEKRNKEAENRLLEGINKAKTKHHYEYVLNEVFRWIYKGNPHAYNFFKKVSKDPSHRDKVFDLLVENFNHPEVASALNKIFKDEDPPFDPREISNMFDPEEVYENLLLHGLIHHYGDEREFAAIGELVRNILNHHVRTDTVIETLVKNFATLMHVEDVRKIVEGLSDNKRLRTHLTNHFSKVVKDTENSLRKSNILDMARDVNKLFKMVESWGRMYYLLLLLSVLNARWKDKRVSKELEKAMEILYQTHNLRKRLGKPIPPKGHTHLPSEIIMEHFKGKPYSPEELAKIGMLKPSIGALLNRLSKEIRKGSVYSTLDIIRLLERNRIMLGKYLRELKKNGDLLRRQKIVYSFYLKKVPKTPEKWILARLKASDYVALPSALLNDLYLYTLDPYFSTNRETYTIEDDKGSVIGTVHLSLHRGKDGSKVLFVQGINVGDLYIDLANSHIGEKIVKGIVEVAKDHGFDEVWIPSGIISNVPHISFVAEKTFRKLGAKEVKPQKKGIYNLPVAHSTVVDLSRNTISVSTPRILGLKIGEKKV